MKYKPLKGLVVAAMLASSLVLAAPQSLAAGPEPSVVTVTGYAQQEVAPDTAYVTIGTTSTDADAPAAEAPVAPAPAEPAAQPGENKPLTAADLYAVKRPAKTEAPADDQNQKEA